MIAWPPLDSLQKVDLDVFGSLTPSEVLYEFEGPCMFTARTTQGITVLAYLSEDLDDEQRLRYIVVITSKRTINELKHGVLSMCEALTLDQKTFWLVDFDYGYHPVQAFLILKEQMPEDAIPPCDTLIWPSLES